MIMYEQDHPDLVRWGLNFLGFSVTPNPNDCICHNLSYARQGNTDPDCRTVENDELIAHALQEEFSQLADAENSGNPQQASVLAQDWMGGPSTGNYNYGNDESDYVGSSTSYEGNGQPSELRNDYFDCDCEVGRRLNNMASIRHVPRINGDIPSVDDATSDHQRLLQRLQMYDLVENKVEGDGNCQFRAISDQFYGSTEHHKFVRQQIVIQLKSHPEIYSGYVPMAYSEYLKKLSNNAEWGDHVTLQAAADSYGIKIFVITSFKNTCYIEILPNVQKSKRVIFLSFWAEVHYNSIYPEGDFPDSKKKKSWWSRNKN